MQLAQHRHADLILLSGFENALMDSIDLSTLGGRIRARRLELGLDQTELATMAGITQPSMSAIESDTTKLVTAKTLGAICRALNMAWEYALDGSGGVEGAPAQSELLSIYRELPTEQARQALLHSARTVMQAIPKPTDPPPAPPGTELTKRPARKPPKKKRG